MGGTVRQYEEGAVIVGDGGEGADKYESNSAITGNNIQDGGSDSDTLQEQELGIDGGDV